MERKKFGPCFEISLKRVFLLLLLINFIPLGRWGFGGLQVKLNFNEGDDIICQLFLLSKIELMQLGRLCLEI